MKNFGVLAQKISDLEQKRSDFSFFSIFSILAQVQALSTKKYKAVFNKIKT